MVQFASLALYLYNAYSCVSQLSHEAVPATTIHVGNALTHHGVPVLPLSTEIRLPQNHKSCLFRPSGDTPQ